MRRFFAGLSLPGGCLPGYSIINLPVRKQEKYVEKQEFPIFREFPLFMIAICDLACYNNSYGKNLTKRRRYYDKN